jgi:hypothetical protein
MTRIPLRLLALGLALLAAGCSPFGGPQCACSPWQLDARLQARLQPDIEAGHASLQRLPDGAVVRLDDTALFSPDGTRLDPAGEIAMARLIEGLFDPAIMRISMADSAAMQPEERGAREYAVKTYFNDARVGPVHPDQPLPPPPGTPPTFDITLQIAHSFHF